MGLDFTSDETTHNFVTFVYYTIINKRPTTMQPKKNKHLILSRYSTLFFNIGLVISLSLVLIAFEWKTDEQTSTVELNKKETSFYELLEDIPQTKQAPLPSPTIHQPLVISLPDEEEIEVELDIDLDVEITEEKLIEEVIFAEAPAEEKAREYFTVVEEMPSYPGGITNFHMYITRKLNYPVKARRAGIEGKIILEFVIEETGEITDVKVVKGIGFGCDEEAIRILESSPKWNAGMQQGKSVKVKTVMAILFDLS